MIGPQILVAVLSASMLFLFALGIAGLMALFKGATELRRLCRATSSDFSSVLLKSPLVPGVSVIVAARDASAKARGLVRRLLDLHYGRHEVVLALDGPSAEDLNMWVEEFRLVRQERTVRGDLKTQPVRAFYISRDPIKLLVVDKEAGGVPDAQNAAIDAAQYPVLGLVDPEAEFIPEWMLKLMRLMLEEWDRVAGVCAAYLPPPLPSLPGRIGALEALRRWLVRGAAFARWHKMVPIPGSCMLLKRDAVVGVGGFHRGLMELFLDLYAQKHEITFLPAAVSWTAPAESIGEVRRQLLYDQVQLADGLRHRGADAGGEFNGLFCIRVVRPIVETAALVLAAVGVALDWIHPALAWLVLLSSIGTGMVQSVAAVVLREMAEPGSREPAYLTRLFLTAIPENVGYRQLRNLWLIGGFFRS